MADIKVNPTKIQDYVTFLPPTSVHVVQCYISKEPTLLSMKGWNGTSNWLPNSSIRSSTSRSTITREKRTKRQIP
ncbi:hypothetical protein QJS04_geneDACA020263 [Acorus gramineus]|uniref:Uncharacterized protein n=1 Tax=Acorus gramineus TaxID=55184 RepID=A0AAV9A4B7_ACOGR|nr:hypothetical protein QJS04_geneDACA020263 [Acorus gramineus]